MQGGKKMKICRKKLAIAMIDKNYNTITLSNIANVSRNTISAIKSGKSCSGDTLLKLAKALEVPVQDLIEE